MQTKTTQVKLTLDAKQIAAPTTAGTGSEVSPAAVLTAGNRTAVPRQQTLAATVDWSSR